MKCQICFSGQNKKIFQYVIILLKILPGKLSNRQGDFFQLKSIDILIISPRKHILWYSLEMLQRGSTADFREKYYLDTPSYLKL